MTRLVLSTAVLVLQIGCIATAPVSISWRSNSSQQYATTDGQATKAADANTVNADRTHETQAAVTTGSGAATTAEQSSGKAATGQ